MHIDPSMSHHVIYFSAGSKVWLFALPTAGNFSVLQDLGADPMHLEDAIPKLRELYAVDVNEEDALVFPACWLHGVITGSGAVLHFSAEVDNTVTLKDDLTLIMKEVEKATAGQPMLDDGFLDEMKASLERKGVQAPLGGRKEVAKIVARLKELTRKYGGDEAEGSE